MGLTEKDWDALVGEVEAEMRALIDRHPVLRRLPDLDRRNAAYCAAWSALGSVPVESITAL